MNQVVTPVHLPAMVGEGEVRLCWHQEDGQSGCITAFGPGDGSMALLSAMDGTRVGVGGTLAEHLSARMSGQVVTLPSLAEDLDRMGYDTRTLVMSIRRKGSQVRPVPSKGEVLHRIRALLHQLHTHANSVEFAMGIVVMDMDTHGRLTSTLAECQLLVDGLSDPSATDMEG